jgi:hypothetical protein
MEVAVTMPSTSNILERLRWKVGLGLVIVAAGFAAQAAPSGTPAHDVARSSWGLAAAATDVARSSWSSAGEPTDVARIQAAPMRSSWG